MALTIATWNVNSITARLPHVLQWLGGANAPDVLCLQEIKCIETKFPADAITQAGYHSVIHGQPTYNGVAILVKQALANSLTAIQKGFPDEDATAQARFLAVTVGDVRVINVYIPNGQAVGSEKYAYKLNWLGILRSYFDNYADPNHKVVLCGDFNVAPADIDVHDPKAWEGSVLCSEPERTAMQQVQQWGLVDTFRQLYPEQVAFSWWDYRQAAFRRNMGLRIDHVWASAPLFATCQAVTIDSEPRTWERPSDHTPVTATFAT